MRISGRRGREGGGSIVHGLLTTGKGGAGSGRGESLRQAPWRSLRNRRVGARKTPHRIRPKTADSASPLGEGEERLRLRVRGPLCKGPPGEGPGSGGEGRGSRGAGRRPVQGRFSDVGGGASSPHPYGQPSRWAGRQGGPLLAPMCLSDGFGANGGVGPGWGLCGGLLGRKATALTRWAAYGPGRGEGDKCSVFAADVFSFRADVFSGEGERAEGRGVRPERMGMCARNACADGMANCAGVDHGAGSRLKTPG